MTLDSGKKVFYKAMPEVVLQQATILFSDEDSIVLDIEGKKDLLVGQRLMISVDGGHLFTKVVSCDQGGVKVCKTWTSSRGYFRVDDVVPLIIRKMAPCEPVGVSRSFSFSENLALTPMERAMPDVDPHVWQMLVNIHSMLGAIMERLDLRSEGFLKAENTKVNMSATGMAFRTKGNFELGDVVEIKMLLPARPSLGVVLYGNVIRADATEKGETDIAVHFGDMSEDLRNEINQYSLMRQREIIRSARE